MKTSYISTISRPRNNKQIAIIALFALIAFAFAGAPSKTPPPTYPSPTPATPTPPSSPPPSSGGWIDADTYFVSSSIPTRSLGEVVAVDSNNNRWVGGVVSGGQLKCGDTLTFSRDDLYLCKFSNTNTGLLGRKLELVGLGDSGSMTGIVVDSSNRVTLFGMFLGTLSLNSSTSLYCPFPNQCAFLVQYSSSGDLLFAKKSNNTKNIVTGELSLDLATGDILATGAYNGSLSFDAVSVPTTLYQDVYVYRFTSSGVAVSAQASSGSSDHSTVARGLHVHTDGTVCLTGSFRKTVDFGSNTLSTTTGNMFVTCLDSGLNWGPSNSLTLSTGANAEGNDIVRSGSTYFVSGRYSGTVTAGSNSPLVCPGSFDLFVATLDTSLAFDSSNKGGCTDGKGLSLVVDKNGNVWQTGVATGPNCTFGSSSYATYMNTFLTKVSSTASYSSASIVGGAAVPAYLSAMAVDSTNKIVETGSAIGSVSFGSHSINPTKTQGFVAVYAA